MQQLISHFYGVVIVTDELAEFEDVTPFPRRLALRLHSILMDPHWILQIDDNSLLERIQQFREQYGAPIAVLPASDLPLSQCKLLGLTKRADYLVGCSYPAGQEPPPEQIAALATLLKLSLVDMNEVLQLGEMLRVTQIHDYTVLAC